MYDVCTSQNEHDSQVSCHMPKLTRNTLVFSINNHDGSSSTLAYSCAYVALGFVTQQEDTKSLPSQNHVLEYFIAN